MKNVVQNLRLKHLFWSLAIIGLGVIFIVRFFPYTAMPSVEDEYTLPITAVGMDPQIALIRDAASDNGWNVVCEGRTGRMSVAKLAPGSLPWRANHEEMWTKLAKVSTALISPGSGDEDAACGWEENSFESIPTERSNIIAVGPPSRLKPLLKLAKSCEVVGARLTDGPPEKQEVYQGAIPANWVGLEIDNSLNRDTGPVSCLVILAHRDWPDGFSDD